MTGDPGALAGALAALPVRVDAIRGEVRLVPAEEYPGGVRPSGAILASGGGHTGEGENVAFTEAEQRDCARRAPALLPRGTGAARPVAELVATAEAALSPYERAALEGALIDLGLRQAGLSLSRLAGAPARARFRWVASFDATDAPLARMAALRARLGDPAVAFKVDVDPAWTEGVIEALAREPARIAVLDFKGRGDAGLVGRLAAAFPAALLEDPPALVPGAARVARDQTLLALDDVAAALDRGEAVNLKAPRMGGFVTVLRALALVDARGPGALAYLGGMHETGVGREQARQLAAIYCPAAPNDLAPLPGGRLSTPGEVALDVAGFGAF